MSDALPPRGLQHARPPCPSPTPRVHPNSCPLVRDAIQPSHPLSSPSPPAANPSQHQGLFQWVNSASGGQSIGVSASASVLPMNTQGWSPSGWTGWISLQSKGLSTVFCINKWKITHSLVWFHSGGYLLWPLEGAGMPETQTCWFRLPWKPSQQDSRKRQQAGLNCGWAWLLNLSLKSEPGHTPVSPVGNTPHFQCRGHGFHPWSGS